MNETVLFVATLSDELARKYWYKTHGEIENDADFYFTRPSKMVEYDPAKMVWIFEPRALRDPNIASFVGDWYPFHGSRDLTEIVCEAREYAPYVCLLRLERQDLDTLEVIEGLRTAFTEVYYADLFDSSYDTGKDILRLSGVLNTMKDFFIPYQPQLKQRRDRFLSRGEEL